MHDHEVELSVGDVLRVGDHTVTVIDIDGEDVSFRVDEGLSSDPLLGGDDRSTLPR